MRKRNDDKQKRILQAARQLFSERGFFYTNVKDIAEKADLGTGTVYLYFESKDDVLIKICMDTFKHVIEDAGKILDSELLPLEKFRKIIGSLIEVMTEDVNISRMFLIEMRQTNEALKNFMPELRKMFIDLIAKLIEEARQQNLIKEWVEPEIVGIASFGIIDSLLFDWVTKGYTKTDLLIKLEKSINSFVYGISKNIAPVS